MRRIFVLLFLCGISTAFSQTTTLEPGVYKSNVKGQNIMLKVFEDNKYEMSFLYGKFTIENDTINFKGKSNGESNFKIKIDKGAAFSSTLKMKFKTPYLFYAGQNIYIGTQKDENSMIEYKPIYDYIKDKDMAYPIKNKELVISVDKTKFIYFVENVQNDITVSKFQMNPDVNLIEVEYEGISLANFQLKGVLDPESKKLSIMEGRKASPLFTFEKEGTEAVVIDNIKPIDVHLEKDWKKNNGFEDEERTEYFGERETSTYTFKHTNLKSYDEALKSVAKSDSKFLVLLFDNSKEGKNKFNDFIKTSEEQMSHYMRRGYNSNRDHFNFYLATEKDKGLLEKFNIKSQPTFVFLNSNGEVVYHTAGTFDEDNSSKFNPSYSVADELIKADAKLKLDKILSNKKTALNDVKKGFLAISKAKGGYFSNYDAAADSTAVMVQEDFDGAAVDTAMAVEADSRLYDDEYYHVDDQQNLYSFKAKKNVVEQKWKDLVMFYTKQSEYDADFLEIAKRELIGQGFTSKLYNDEATNYDLDFIILDYIFKNYEQILKKEKPIAPIDEYDDMDYRVNEEERTVEIDRILSSFFSKRLSNPATAGAATKEKYMKYNKMFLKLSGYNLANFKLYIEKLGEDTSLDKSFYFAEYDDFFKTITTKNSSIIETLDSMFTDQKNNFLDWSDFKQIYSGLANTVAWDVVELKTKDMNLIQKAIQWSESSVKVENKSPYYLDTLGQLYYMNNEKEKAIITEQKAINCITTDEKEQLKTYTEVLEKMKNGTY